MWLQFFGMFLRLCPCLQYIYSLSHYLVRSLNLDLRPQVSRLEMGPIRPVQPRLKTEGLDQLRILASFIIVWAESYGLAPVLHFFCESLMLSNLEMNCWDMENVSFMMDSIFHSQIRGGLFMAKIVMMELKEKIK